MKYCHKCDSTLDDKCFRPNRSRKDGLNGTCIDCEKLYKKNHYQANRQKYIDKSKNTVKEKVKWFREYKKTLKCSRCPEDHPACIQFHHIDPSIKEGTIRQGISSGWSWKRIKDEIAKCEVICSNCHFKEHWIDG